MGAVAAAGIYKEGVCMCVRVYVMGNRLLLNVHKV